MGEPTKRGSSSGNGRGKSPTVSLIAAATLIIACIVFVGIWYISGSSVRNGDLDDEQITSEEPTDPTESITTTPPTTTPPPTPGQRTPPVKVRGMYVDAWTMASEEDLKGLIEICNTSDMNAIVIDVKDDYGYIPFLGDDESLDAVRNEVIPDIRQLISRLKDHGIYTIARLVCFRDPLGSGINPELAIRDIRGATWKDGRDVSWLNPYNKASWEYLAAVAKEAVRVGFDEIQLDYVRFPADGILRDIDFGAGAEGKTKAEVICEFLEYIRKSLDGSAWLAADVFGIIAVAKGDHEGIGQDLDIMLQHVDYVCPMIYPSHFANKTDNGTGQYINGVLYEAPDLDPYGVVYNIMKTIHNRLPDDGNHAIVRPYLQAFTASYLGAGYYKTYTAVEVLEQVQANHDAGFDEWLLWNHSGIYSIYESVGKQMGSWDMTATPASIR